MRRELEANRPSRTKEVFTGAVTGMVGALSFVGHPFVQLYEWGKGQEVVTMKDSVQVLGEAGKYLKGEQTEAWTMAAGALKHFEAQLNNFYEAYNIMAKSLLSGDAETMERAKGLMATAAQNLQDSHADLSGVQTKYRAELAQLDGFFDLSKGFLKDAAIEVAITVTAVKGLELAFKGARAVIPHLSVKVAEKLGAVAGGAAQAEKIALTAQRTERAIVAAERIEETGIRTGHAYESYEEIDHTARKHEAVK
jgi:hypothetical protein